MKKRESYNSSRQNICRKWIHSKFDCNKKSYKRSAHFQLGYKLELFYFHCNVRQKCKVCPSHVKLNQLRPKICKTKFSWKTFHKTPPNFKNFLEKKHERYQSSRRSLGMESLKWVLWNLSKSVLKRTKNWQNFHALSSTVKRPVGMVSINFFSRFWRLVTFRCNLLQNVNFFQ